MYIDLCLIADSDSYKYLSVYCDRFLYVSVVVVIKRHRRYNLFSVTDYNFRAIFSDGSPTFDHSFFSDWSMTGVINKNYLRSSSDEKAGEQLGGRGVD